MFKDSGTIEVGKFESVNFKQDDCLKFSPEKETSDGMGDAASKVICFLMILSAERCPVLSFPCWVWELKSKESNSASQVMVEG